MELRHLRYFIRAAEMLHFTKAAESLYISQPSLSIHIQQLEEDLKTKLFARVGRNVLLTESGQVFLQRAKRAVEEMEAAEREIDALNGLLRGNLTIATVPLYGSKYLPSCIKAFNKLHPQVHIVVRVSRAEEIEAGLVAGTFDLGFSLLPAERTELQTRAMLDDNIVMVVAKDHPLAQKEAITAEDLSAVLMAFPSHKLASARPIVAYFDSIGVTPNIVVEQDDGHALIELVKLGGFATFLPEQTIRVDDSFVLRQLPSPGAPLQMAAMWTQLSPAAKAFVEVVDSLRAEKEIGVKKAKKGK